MPGGAAVLPLRPDAEGPNRFHLRAERAWCTWNGLYGGTHMAALIEAMERVSGLPIIAFGAQFLSNVAEGDDLDITVGVDAPGKTVWQTSTAAMLGDRPASRATGVCGALVGDTCLSSVMPTVPAPTHSPVRSYPKPLPGGLNETLDVRIAHVSGTKVFLWVRCPSASGTALSGSLLARFADHPPWAISRLYEVYTFGITLDATLRVCGGSGRHAGDAWVLLEITFDAIHESIAFATVNLWSEAGDLLALSTQTMRVRQQPGMKR